MEVTGEFSPNHDTVVVCYQLKDEEPADPGNTSIASASFVTSYARLNLYKFIEKVNEIGDNTNSIIFIRKPGDPVIEIGELTDELPTSVKCVRFVSG